MKFTGTLEAASLTGSLSAIETLKGFLSSEQSLLTGKLTVPTEAAIEVYRGIYTVIPLPFQEQTLETANKKMLNDVVVKEIPYFQTANLTGDTIYIGG